MLATGLIIRWAVVNEQRLSWQSQITHSIFGSIFCEKGASVELEGL